MNVQSLAPGVGAVLPEGEAGQGSGGKPGTQSPEQARRDEVIPEIIAEFSQVFAAARSRWTRYAEEVHPELRGVGLMVLQTIIRKGPVTATGIAGLLSLDKAVVSRQVAKLRDMKLVDAVAAESDRRVTLLTASPAAHAAIDELHSETAGIYRERFAEWEADNLVQLRELLHRFNSAAEELRGEGPARRCAQEAGAADATAAANE